MPLSGRAAEEHDIPGSPSRADDPGRPAFHLTARSGWINDPLGLTWHGGRYHVFFQYVPDRTDWAVGVHWGHATSADLLHWREEAVALAPDDGDDGVWSGCVVTDGTRTVLFATSVRADRPELGRVRSATPRDEHWTEWEKGPIVAEPARDAPVAACRDPFVFRDGDGWRMLVGAALPDGVAGALAYRSPDLETWTYDGILAQRSSDDRDPVWTGTLWECPQRVRIDGKSVLIVSVWDADRLHHVAYALGEDDGRRFRPRAWRRLSFGDSCYAPSVFHDRDGRPGLIFWLRGVGGDGWAGALSVPHLLRLDGEVLVARPHPALDLQRLRDPGATTSTVPLPEGRGAFALEAASGIEIAVLGDDGVPCAVVLAGHDAVEIRVRTGDVESVPRGAGGLTIVVDGPVLEVSTGAAVHAAAIRPADRLRLSTPS